MTDVAEKRPKRKTKTPSAWIARSRNSLATPPGPGVTVHFLQFLKIKKQSTIEILQILRNDYGTFCHVKLWPTWMYFVFEPELVKRVLVTDHKNYVKGPAVANLRIYLGNGLLTSEGRLHREQRKLMQPLFHVAPVQRYAAQMAEIARATRDRWRDGEEIDMDHEIMRMTLAIVGKTLFNADVEKEAKEIGAALTDLMKVFDRAISPWGIVLNYLPLPNTIRMRRSLARIDATINRLMEEHRAGGNEDADLLAMLLAAQDEPGSTMSDRQVRDEAITLFLAGHETTANALTWSFYLISQHPEVEAKLHEELDTVLQGRAPEYEDVARLPWTKLILKEALRLYPPAYMLARQAVVDTELGGYTVPAGSIVVLSPYMTQRDPRFFEAPEEFRPERWTPEFEEQLPKFAWYAFGGGPRTCIGEGFAWVEGILALATLAQTWRAETAPDQVVEPGPVVTLRPKNGIRMILRRR